MLMRLNFTTSRKRPARLGILSSCLREVREVRGSRFEMTQQVFVNSSKFSAPVMTLDRDLQKHGVGSFSSCPPKIWRLLTVFAHFI